MAFNKKYLQNSLERRYGFTVEKDGTGLAYHAFLDVGKDCISLSGPWADQEAAKQCGMLKLIEMIEAGEVKRRPA